MNPKDLLKSMEIEAVAGTGVTMSVLPMDLIQKLGLEGIDEVMQDMQIIRRNRK